jgi:hypothetical protein
LLTLPPALGMPPSPGTSSVILLRSTSVISVQLADTNSTPTEAKNKGLERRI